jgi:hypothetical protein
MLVSRVALKTRKIIAKDADSFGLYQNEPNPFRGSTNIQFSLPEDAMVTFSIWDVTGKVMDYRKIDGKKGMNSLSLEADILGKTGVYYYKIETAAHSGVRKMILLE